MWLLLIIALLLSGCSYIDWGGVWFGCPKGQVKKPATYKMFGTVNQSSKCVPEIKKPREALPNGVTQNELRRMSDFAYCRDNGLKESVDVCMEKKDWRHP